MLLTVVIMFIIVAGFYFIQFFSYHRVRTITQRKLGTLITMFIYSIIYDGADLQKLLHVSKCRKLYQ